MESWATSFMDGDGRLAAEHWRWPWHSWGGWINSLSETDIFTLPLGRLPIGILISSGGYFSCTWADYSDAETYPEWSVSQRAIDLSDCGYLFDFSENQRQWCGFQQSFGCRLTTIVDFSSMEELANIDSTASALFPENTISGVAEISAEELVERPLESRESDTEKSPANDILLVNAEAPVVGYDFSVVASGDSLQAMPFALWAIPHWAVVLPLTAVSAYLLLTKPCSARD